jgi:NADP-dependent 3-hydroxy acid dehydrogenase YdfG
VAIEGKVVAITGASSGIGEATAKLLASRGAKVVLGARGEKRLQAVAAHIARSGGEVAFRPADVTSRDDLAGLVAMSKERFGKLDVLISNAGVMPIGPLTELAVDDWMQTIDVGLKGLMHGIAAALPLFQEQGSGHFIHTASTAARKVVQGQAVYAGTKAAVLAISDGLRQELAGKVRVTVILPGYTNTDFTSHIRDPKLRAQMEQSREQFAMSPDAVARAIAYAIDEPDNVNIGEIVVRPAAQP